MNRYRTKNYQIVEDWNNRIVVFCSLGVAGIGGVTLILWLLGTYDSMNPYKHYVPMVDEAAFGFLIFGIVLAILSSSINNHKLRNYFVFLVLLLMLIGLLCIIDYATGYSYGLSNFLGRKHLMIDNIQTGRMSLITGICFITESIALLFIIGNAKQYSVIFSILSLLIGYVIVVGYVYKVPILSEGNITPALLPSILFVFSAIGLICAAGADTYPVKCIIGQSVRDRLLRIFIPAIFILSQMQSFILSRYSGKYDSSYALTNGVSSICLLVISGVIIFLISKAIGTSIDKNMSAREKAEQVLQEREEQYRLLLENMNDLVCEIDLDGCYTFVNENYLDTLGYHPKELLGTKASDLMHPNDSKISSKKFQHLLASLEPSLDIWRFRHKNGEYRLIESKGKVYLNAKNEKRNVIISRDITDKMRVEEELIDAKEKAEESDRLKSAFLANMSHEIRTPMNGIIGFAELLKEPKLTNDEQQEFISMIESSGKRMLNLINDIVDISRIDSGQISLHVEESNINELIEYIYNFFKPEVTDKGMNLIHKISLPNNQFIIPTDKEKLFAILSNLVKNAIKYSDRGTIEFGYEFKGNYIEFFVKDQGIGIPKERQKAIFERFIQADIGDKRAYEGAGLGLAISKSYVEMLGGKIWVESVFGEGAVFYFTLPYNKQLLDPTIDSNHNVENVSELPLRKLKVLIAEDDQISERLISLLIKDLCEEILVVGTGLAAVETCRDNSDIDLVLMDIRMPEMGGYEASRLIRSFNKDVIIIAQSAYVLSGDRKKAIEAGCNDYITKPINSKALMDLLIKYFRSYTKLI